MKAHNVILKKGITALLVLIISFIPWSPSVKGSNDGADIWEGNKKSVVYVKAYDKNNNFFSSGCGVIISADGLMAANYHIFDKCLRAEVILKSGETIPVSGVVSYNCEKDIAILKLDNKWKMPFAKLDDSTKISEGNLLTDISRTDDLKDIICSGKMNTTRESIIRKGNDIVLPIQKGRGSAGGGVFNDIGEMVGLSYPCDDDYSSSIEVIPSNDINELLDKRDFKTFKQVKEEKYPAVSYDKLSEYLSKKYSNYELNGIKLSIDDIKILGDNEDDKSLYVLLIMNNYNYSLLCKALSVKNHSCDYNMGLLENMLTNIGNEISIRYCDKTVGAGLYYVDNLADKPDLFKDSELEYNKETGMWHVVHSIVMFSNINGNFQFIQ